MLPQLRLGTATATRTAGFVTHRAMRNGRVYSLNEAATADVLAWAEAHVDCQAVLAEYHRVEKPPIITASAPVGPSASALPPGCLRVTSARDETA